VIESCTIITVAANKLMREIHDRMPATLKTQDVEVWLDPSSGQLDVLEMLAPYPDELIEAYPVGHYVNSHRHNSPGCVA
jgi:putative SOS response-associated peptidase YedK